MDNLQQFYDMGWKHALQQVQSSLSLTPEQVIKLEKLYK